MRRRRDAGGARDGGDRRARQGRVRRARPGGIDRPRPRAQPPAGRGGPRRDSRGLRQRASAGLRGRPCVARAGPLSGRERPGGRAAARRAREQRRRRDGGARRRSSGRERRRSRASVRGQLPGAVPPDRAPRAAPRPVLPGPDRERGVGRPGADRLRRRDAGRRLRRQPRLQPEQARDGDDDVRHRRAAGRKRCDGHVPSSGHVHADQDGPRRRRRPDRFPRVRRPGDASADRRPRARRGHGPVFRPRSPRPGPVHRPTTRTPGRGCGRSASSWSASPHSRYALRRMPTGPLSCALLL